MSLASQVTALATRIGAEIKTVRAEIPALVAASNVAQMRFLKGTAPATPASGLATLYIKADGLLYTKDDAGTERQITATQLITNGVRAVDSFAGANDSAKMTAALAFVQAEDAAGRYMPWLLLPDRNFNTGSTSFAGFNGIKIVGPGVPMGPNNIQIDEQLINGKWSTSCGSGASSLFNFTAETYGVKFVGIVFHGGSTSQIFRSTVNVYAAQFDNLFFYGVKHAFGAPTEKFLMTQVIFSGHWGFSGCVDTLGTVGGSDHSLWMGSSFANMDLAQDGGGKPMWIFNGMSKTDVGKMYVTNRNNWIGVQTIGNDSNDIAFFGGEFEGVSASTPSLYPIFDIQGGSVTFYSPKTGQVSHLGTAQGVCHQSGGQLTVYSPTYRRGSATPATFPWLYQTGGTAKIHDPAVLTSGEQMRVRTSDGLTLTLADHANDFVSSEVETYIFSANGVLTAQTGVSRVPIAGTYVVESVGVYCDTLPTGTAVLVDVNKNGTTIFGTQLNRPTVTAGGSKTAWGGAVSNGTFVFSDVLSVDIDATDGVAANLTVTIRLRRVG